MRLGLVLLGWTLLSLGGGTLVGALVFGGDDAAALVGSGLALPAIWLVGLVVLWRVYARTGE